MATIEKEKALDVVRQMVADGQVSQDVAEKYFPELAESEDERIELLYYLYDVHDDDEERARWIAWLEKQGEEIIPLEQIILNVWELGNYWKELTKGFCNTEYGTQLDYIAKHWKEGEHYIKSLKKQGEQKTVDKVEPKFKVGDWVVVDNGRTGKIIECTKDFADVDLEFSCLLTKVKNIRSWTIQDAKDGDVLYLQKDGKEHIIIYKGVIKERFRTFVSAYCAYNGIVDAFCFADVNRYVDIAYRGIMPATKEQRDLLFQKMKEAGYEWDAEKKELKKIEQKPAWSEEDEMFVHGLIRGLSAKRDIHGHTTFSSDCIDITETIDWLKSLKGRVQPQTTWKPSGLQLQALNDATYNCNNEYSPYLESLYNDLKKLKG